MILLRLCIFFGLLLLEQWFGPLVFCLGIYLVNVGLRPKLLTFVVFTLTCSWLISNVILVAWFVAVGVLFLSLNFWLVFNRVFASVRVGLVLSTGLGSLLLLFITNGSVDWLVLIKLAFSLVLLSLILWRYKTLLGFSSNWHLA